MKNKINWLLLSLVCLTNCKPTTPNASTLLLSTTFQQEETKELVQFIKQLDVEICATMSLSVQHPERCYKAYFDFLAQDAQLQTDSSKITAIQLERLLATLNPELQQEFWKTQDNYLHRKIPNSTPNITFPDTIQVRTISLQGKYMDFLKNDLKPISKMASLYVDHILRMNDIHPSSFLIIQQAFAEQHFADDRIKLVLALHIVQRTDAAIQTKQSYDELFRDVERVLQKRIQE